jgi:hypothetical protein
VGGGGTYVVEVSAEDGTRGEYVLDPIRVVVGDPREAEVGIVPAAEARVRAAALPAAAPDLPVELARVLTSIGPVPTTGQVAARPAGLAPSVSVPARVAAMPSLPEIPLAAVQSRRGGVAGDSTMPPSSALLAPEEPSTGDLWYTGDLAEPIAPPPASEPALLPDQEAEAGRTAPLSRQASDTYFAGVEAPGLPAGLGRSAIPPSGDSLDDTGVLALAAVLLGAASGVVRPAGARSRPPQYRPALRRE